MHIVAKLWNAVRALYVQEPPADPAVWHEWQVTLPVRTLEGGIAFDKVWRRKTASGLEYRKRLETPDEWEARQW